MLPSFRVLKGEKTQRAAPDARFGKLLDISDAGYLEALDGGCYVRYTATNVEITAEKRKWVIR